MSNVIAFNRNRRRSSADEDGNAHDRRLLPADDRTDSSMQEAASSGADVLVSVVVPTYGRPHLLSHCLASLLAQRFEPSRFEIIVVDDGPSPATLDVVADWSAHTAPDGPAITYIASDGPHGPAAARNRGWRAARGPIIAFTDDDTVAGPDWLKNGLNAFDMDVQAVWGRIVMPLPRPAAPTDYERDAKNLERAEFVTANCFCPKHVLEELGGFDERFRFAWREDADLYFRLLGRPGRVVHEPSAVITHPIRPASWGVSLSQQKKILFDALLYKKHPALYRQKIRAKPRWDYYLVVAALLVCVVALGLGRFGAAAAAGGAWLFLTARFCLERLAPTAKTPAHIAEMMVTSALIPPLAVFWRLIGAIKFRVRFV
ncbi:MAG: glycosyltransferase [Herminiimonas sp.]|nr:glycosyltransferase [Herminiimonas sp.]